MRRQIVAMSVILFIAYGCATTTQQPAQPQPEKLHGVASWYGQEFAGRTTANGEIFDPMLFTAAHRTLPFGTVLDVMNSKTGQVVRVRINDRGPFVGNRMIDLSYAAAQQIGLIDPGSGEVDLKVVSIGRGDREPPAAYTVTVPQPAEVKISAAEPPKVEFPLPAQVTATPAPVPVTPAPVVVDSVAVVEKHGDTYTRRTVGADGRTIEAVPTETPVPEATRTPVPKQSPLPVVRGEGARRAGEGKSFVVQVGAFTVEANAKALQARLTALGQSSHIDHDALYRVRLGPYATRDEAIRARGALEANGISAIVVAP